MTKRLPCPLSTSMVWNVTVTVESQAQRIMRLKRRELLEAAVAEVSEHGWRGLQMQLVAKRVGVSRQTVYNTFSGRDGLAAALIEHLTDSFLTGFDEAFSGTSHPFAQWQAAIHYLLRRGSDDPALRAMLGADARAGDQFLNLLTSGSGPIVATAKVRMTQTAQRFQPGVDAERVSKVAEILTRLTLSNIVQAMESPEQTAATVAEMVIGFLELDVPHF